MESVNVYVWVCARVDMWSFWNRLLKMKWICHLIVFLSFFVCCKKYSLGWFSELQETATTNSGGKFNCLPIPKLSRESPRPSISVPKRTLPAEMSVFPVSANIGDDSQRSSISSASGQSVTTQCTTTGTRTDSVKKSDIGNNVNHKTSSKDDEDEGLIFKPLLSTSGSPPEVPKTNFV